VHGSSTHVDFLVRSKHGLLVCECKRVNPAQGIWVFGKSGHATTYLNEGQAVVHEALTPGDVPRSFFVERRECTIPNEGQYHVPFELKTDSKAGDPHGSPRGRDLGAAITQALKSVNGITDAIVTQSKLMGEPPFTMIPVVFTTAKLVTCETDLSEADLTTGELPKGLKTTETPWLWLRQACTPELRHQQPFRAPASVTVHGFNDLLNTLFARSIAIVSTSNKDGVALFLRAAAFHVGDDYSSGPPPSR
jgi:hypothetical protein